MTPQKTQAIQAALLGNWENAIAINLAIIENDPADTETLNRLAFAFTVVGKITDAKKTYQKVLAVDHFNPIAQKNLKRLAGTTNKAASPLLNHTLTTDLFLEEAGKTKVLFLKNTAQPNIIQKLQIGQQVELVIKRLKIFVLTNDKQYIGMLPDNTSRRLIRFMTGGNKYEAYVKSVTSKDISVFIKEVKHAARFKNQASFPLNDMLVVTTKPATQKAKKHYADDSSEADEAE